MKILKIIGTSVVVVVLVFLASFYVVLGLETTTIRGGWLYGPHYFVTWIAVPVAIVASIFYWASKEY